MNFALNQMMAVLIIYFRGRDRRPDFLGRFVHGVDHRQRRKNVFSRQHIQRFAREPFDDFRHQDNAEVRIDLFRSGLVFKRLGENLLERVLLRLRRSPVFLEWRQPRRVRK